MTSSAAVCSRRTAVLPALPPGHGVALASGAASVTGVQRGAGAVPARTGAVSATAPARDARTAPARDAQTAPAPVRPPAQEVPSGASARRDPPPAIARPLQAAAGPAALARHRADGPRLVARPARQAAQAAGPVERRVSREWARAAMCGPPRNVARQAARRSRQPSRRAAGVAGPLPAAAGLLGAVAAAAAGPLPAGAAGLAAVAVAAEGGEAGEQHAGDGPGRGPGLRSSSRCGLGTKPGSTGSRPEPARGPRSSAAPAARPAPGIPLTGGRLRGDGRRGARPGRAAPPPHTGRGRAAAHPLWGPGGGPRGTGTLRCSLR